MHPTHTPRHRDARVAAEQLHTALELIESDNRGTEVHADAADDLTA